MKKISETKSQINPDLIEASQKALLEMVQKNETRMILPKPFHGMTVVLGDEPGVLTPIEVPEELKNKISKAGLVFTSTDDTQEDWWK